MSQDTPTDYHECRICNTAMHIPDGHEPTDICHDCAHEEVARLTNENAARAREGK